MKNYKTINLDLGGIMHIINYKRQVILSIAFIILLCSLLLYPNNKDKRFSFASNIAETGQSHKPALDYLIDEIKKDVEKDNRQVYEFLYYLKSFSYSNDEIFTLLTPEYFNMQKTIIPLEKNIKGELFIFKYMPKLCISGDREVGISIFRIYKRVNEKYMFLNHSPFIEDNIAYFNEFALDNNFIVNHYNINEYVKLFTLLTFPSRYGQDIKIVYNKNDIGSVINSKVHCDKHLYSFYPAFYFCPEEKDNYNKLLAEKLKEVLKPIKIKRLINKDTGESLIKAQYFAYSASDGIFSKYDIAIDQSGKVTDADINFYNFGFNFKEKKIYISTTPSNYEKILKILSSKSKP